MSWDWSFCTRLIIPQKRTDLRNASKQHPRWYHSWREGLGLGSCRGRRHTLGLCRIPSRGQSKGSTKYFSCMMWEFPWSSYWTRYPPNCFTESASSSLIISGSYGIYMKAVGWWKLHGWLGINIIKLLLSSEMCKVTLLTYFLSHFQTLHNPDDLKYFSWCVCVFIRCGNIASFDTQYLGHA